MSSRDRRTDPSSGEGQAGDIADKAEDVIRGIGRGFSDVAHDVAS